MNDTQESELLHIEEVVDSLSIEFDEEAVEEYADPEIVQTRVQTVAGQELRRVLAEQEGLEDEVP